MNLSDDKFHGRVFVFALALYALAICLVALRAYPPAAKLADAPADEFSGMRAKNVLQQLVGNGVAHPVGSAADAKVREGIVAQLTKLGYQPRVQDGFVCDEGRCAHVKNVLARLEGRDPATAVLVAAHYDSVPAGPGASDDGAGTVSVLEIARALKTSPQLRHSVIFLLDEGEEAGLYGAVAFVQDDPWAKDVRAAVNMDNRGTSGPSAMFETGSANEWVMRMYASSVRFPNANSLFYTVYKSLPNDTDFTIFKRAGYQGLNFAFIGEVAHYHTPLDNVANASAASIQNEGGNGLDGVRALANSDLQPGAISEAVYADILGWKMIWWPARWTVGFAVFALALLLLEIAVLLRRGEIRMKGIALGVASWPLILIVSAILGVLLQFLLRVAGATPANWVAHPFPLLVAFWALGFAAVAIVAALLGRSAGLWGLWCGVWIWWGIAALVLGIIVPGVSFFFVVPALAAGICGSAVLFAGRESRSASAIATVVPAVVTAIVGAESVWFLYVALGDVFLVGIAVCVALIAMPLAPLAASISRGNRWKFSAVAFATVIAGTVAALIVPPFSSASPETLNLQYHLNADTGKSRWLAYPGSGRLPPSLRSAASFGRAQTAVYPWSTQKPLAADAPALNVPAPTMSILHVTSSGGNTSYDVQLNSPRGAPVILLGFAPDAAPESVSIAGHAMPAMGTRFLRYTHGWRIYGCDDAPPEGIEMKFTLRNGNPVSALLLDESYGLPKQGTFLSSARPETATQIQNGDATVVTRHISLKPE
ncbi:MAG TPA: M28 family peptidase [Candidatus Acidoferrales bacterium]|nr:M28 family peptidase [Candidatus Acidoferrales bacterium]